MYINLKPLLEEADAKGWATSIGAIEDVRRLAPLADLVEVEIRQGDGSMTKLKPSRKEEAPELSLSALVGLGASLDSVDDSQLCGHGFKSRQLHSFNRFDHTRARNCNASEVPSALEPPQRAQPASPQRQLPL